MDKEKLKQMAQDPRFISGIYNYCDRWCERCPFTSRCLNYATDEEDQDNPASHDIDSKGFWNKLEESLTLAMELLQDMAKEQGIDLNDIDMEEIHQEQERSREAAESHELSRSARQYAKMVDDWFDQNEKIFKHRQKELENEMELGIEMGELINEAESIADATEVIGWYQHQIYVKLMRALTHPDIDDEEDEIQNDSNGSAKVALIGIERSIGAWGKLHDHFPEQTDSILDFLLHLDRLRKKVDISFPHARAFKRPGFDD